MIPAEIRVLEAAGHLSRHLSPLALEKISGALESLPIDSSDEAIFQCTKVLVDDNARSETAGVLTIWRKEAAHLSPPTFAWVLRSARSADSWRARQERVEAVWTGPSLGPHKLRRTDAALVEVINYAKHHLWMVTFAAYNIKPVMAALQHTVSRDVKVSFVGESSTENEALTSGGVAELRLHLPAAVAFYIWPLEKRMSDDKGNIGALHAKFAVADGEVALVSSANLTGHALKLNIEAGTLIRGGNVPATLEAQLERMISEGILRKLA